MSQPNEIPSFEKINKCHVSIKSLRNQLQTSQNIDELTVIASKIIELEHTILFERQIGCQKLNKKKVFIINKIDRLKRQLFIAKNELNNIENILNLKLNKYKEKLERKIEDISIEYEKIVAQSNATIIKQHNK